MIKLIKKYSMWDRETVRNRGEDLLLRRPSDSDHTLFGDIILSHSKDEAGGEALVGARPTRSLLLFY